MIIKKYFFLVLNAFFLVHLGLTTTFLFLNAPSPALPAPLTPFLLTDNLSYSLFLIHFGILKYFYRPKFILPDSCS
jgi:hypothetical protein